MLNLSSNIGQALSLAQRMSRQMPFVQALALTDTAGRIRDAMPAQLERDLDRPTPFTKAGFYSTRADKVVLVAHVGVRPIQAKYLIWQIEGGARAPSRKALRLPGEVDLNAYGNMPAGLVRQLIARAKAGKRTTRSQAARFGVSQQLDLFYGEPGDGRPAGVYKRVVISATRHQLVPVVLFPQAVAQYQKRFDFYGTARRVAQQEFPDALRRAWRRAVETAR